MTDHLYTLNIEITGADRAEIAELLALLSRENGVAGIQHEFGGDAGFRPGELHASAASEVLKIVLDAAAGEIAKEAGKALFAVVRQAIQARLEQWKAAQAQDVRTRIHFELAADGDLLISPPRQQP